MFSHVLVWSASMLTLPMTTKVSTTFSAAENQDKMLGFTSVEWIFSIFLYFSSISINRKIQIFKAIRHDNGTS